MTILRPSTLAALSIGLGSCISEVHAERLDASIFTELYGYEIRYHETDNTDSDWYVEETDAKSIANFFDYISLGSPFGIHSAHLAAGFLPSNPDGREVRIVPDNKVKEDEVPDTNPNANRYRIELPIHEMEAIGYNSPASGCICAHEGHHQVQFSYVGGDTRYAATTMRPMVYEGLATVASDSLLSMVDDVDFRGTDWMPASYHSAYLDTYDESEKTISHDDHLWENGGYETSLFWRYLMEQFGEDRTEPGVGLDFAKRLYEIAAEDKPGLTTLLQSVLDEKDRFTTPELDRGLSLESVFQDFNIANYTRRFRTSDSWSTGFTFELEDPARFYYLDEAPPNAPFTTRYTVIGGGVSGEISSMSQQIPAMTTFDSLAVGESTSIQNIEVSTWGTQYVESRFTGPFTGDSLVGFWAVTGGGASSQYSVIGRRRSGKIDLVAKGSATPEPGNKFQFATMQSAADPYVSLVGVITGLSCNHENGDTTTTVSSSYQFAHVQPTVEIMEPSSARPAYVGDLETPDRFLVRLKVTAPPFTTGASVEGLTAEAFTVSVGSTPNPYNHAPVLSAAYVQGEYWLQVQAPMRLHDQSPEPVWVELGDIVVSEQEAVVYADLQVAQSLVIDRSGSMAQTSSGMSRVEAARAAAQLFVDVSGGDDQVGVVRFSGDGAEPDASTHGDAEIIVPLVQMTSQFERDLTNLMIDASNPAGDLLTPQGKTSIGDGLYWGTKQLVDSALPTAERWIILMSDGHQNEPSKFSDQKSYLLSEGVHVETIALGPNCDKNHLQAIATNTSGRYYEVAAATSGAASAASSKSSKSASTSSASVSSAMRIDLADAYLASSDRIQRRERIMEQRFTLAAGGVRELPLSLAEGGLEDAVAALMADRASSGLSLSITRPGGTNLPLPEAGYTASSPSSTGRYWDPKGHIVYRIPSMEDGDWTLRVENTGTQSVTAQCVVSGRNRQGVQARLHFTQFHGSSTAYDADGLFLRGLPMPVIATLTDGSGPVLGATVRVLITHPERTPVTLRLRDDGGGHDGLANDGVYGATFCATTKASGSGGGADENAPPSLTGSYQVTLESQGTDNLGRSFQRISRSSFQIYEEEQGLGGDSDGDGMPDRYETLHSGLDALVADAALDLDQDGLSNLDEYENGTDPLSMDTDGGGETDRSEVDAGANPLDSTDDALSAPLMAQVVNYSARDHIRPESLSHELAPKSGENIIALSMESNYSRFEIERSTSSTGPFSHIGTTHVADEGIFHDQGLANGTRYYYRAVPYTAAGRKGVPTRVFSGVPRSDPFPPSGSVRIDAHSPATSSGTVHLAFSYTPDAVQMRVGLGRNLSHRPWLPVIPSITGFSIGSPAHGSEVLVSVEYRDAAGNTGLFSDRIQYLAPSLSSGLTATLVAPGDPSGAGARVRVCPPGSSDSRFEVSAQAGGQVSFRSQPGLFDIHIALRGYAPIFLPGRVLPPGGILALGTLTFVPLDSDGDALTDSAEIRTHGTNRKLADTDGDGQADGLEVTVLFTDPLDENSTLKIESMSVQNVETGTVSIRFESVPGVNYRFEYSTDLISWSPYRDNGSDYQVTAASTSTEVSLTPETGTTTGALFIRIAVD